MKSAQGHINILYCKGIRRLCCCYRHYSYQMLPTWRPMKVWSKRNISANKRNVLEFYTVTDLEQLRHSVRTTAPWNAKQHEGRSKLDSQSIRFPCIMLSCIWSRTTYISYRRLSVVSALAIPEAPERCVVAKHSPIDRASYPRRPEYPDRLLTTHWKMGYGLTVLKCGKISYKIYWRCQTTEQLSDNAVISQFQKRQVILHCRKCLRK
jgi:hypothetical protein